MLLIWRGWGLLAVVALFPLLASCAGLITVEPKWIFMTAMSASLLLGGAVCISCGTRWNRRGNEHSLYFVPLQVWGWIYWAVALMLVLMSFGGGVFRMLKPLPGPRDPGRLDPTHMAVGGGLGIIVVVATAWALVRSARRSAAEVPARGHATDEAVDGEI